MINREKVHLHLLNMVDDGYDLMAAYDAVPHRYGEFLLFQTEAKTIQFIGCHPSSTITDLANANKKTTSAYSQIIRKLVKKGWVRQERNEKNHRLYNLFLTEEGKKVYNSHHEFETKCYQRMFEKLSVFSDEELEIFCAVHKKLNESYELDLQDSLEEMASQTGSEA